MIKTRKQVFASIRARLIATYHEETAARKDDKAAEDLPISDDGESTILHKVMQSGIQIDGDPRVEVDGDSTVITIDFADHNPDNIIDQLSDLLGSPSKGAEGDRAVVWKIGSERAIFDTSQDQSKGWHDFELVIHTK